MGSGVSIVKTDEEIKSIIQNWFIIASDLSKKIKRNSSQSPSVIYEPLTVQIKTDLKEMLSLEISDELSFKFSSKIRSLERKDYHIHRTYQYIMYMLDIPPTAQDEKFVAERPTYSCKYSEGEGPYGVSLQFLHHFIDKYNISETMTTAEVVRDIIIPETSDTKQTFLESKLSQSYPHYWSDLRENHRRYPPQKYGLTKDFDGFAFVSHAWCIPFRTLVNSVQRSWVRKWNTDVQFFILYADECNLVEEYDDRVFLWVDVFCKNQHIPSPAMEEFYRAIEIPRSVLAVFYPGDNPIAINRIWCLFELFTAIRLGVSLRIGSPDENLYGNVVKLFLRTYGSPSVVPPPQQQQLQQQQPKEEESQVHQISDISSSSCSEGVTNTNNNHLDPTPNSLPPPPTPLSQAELSNPQRFEKLGIPKMIDLIKQCLTIDVEKAQATVPADITMIMSLIRESVGIESMNETIYQYLAQEMITMDYQKLGDFSPACYGEETLVRVKGRGLVKISDVSEGEMVMITDPVPDYHNDNNCNCHEYTEIEIGNISSDIGLEIEIGLDLESLSHEKKKMKKKKKDKQKKKEMNDVNVEVEGEGNNKSLYDVIELITCDDIESGMMELCYTREGIYITPEHPIFDHESKKWVLPKDLYEVKKYPMKRVYNIELRGGNSVCLSGGLDSGNLLAISLGNNLRLFPETDEMYGYGWKREDNIHRLKYLKKNQRRIQDAID